MNTIHGRNQFSRYKVFINFLCVCIRWTPKLIRSFLWDMSRPFGGNISLLLRYSILKADSEHIGENVYIGRSVTILNRKNLSIGNNVSIHETCYIDAIGGCYIGNDVSIAHGCSILSFDHTWNIQETAIKYNPIVTSPVRIANDVWIGAGVRLLSGTSIETRSVVAAGAVVTRPIAPGSLYGGIPAKKIRDLPQNKIDNPAMQSPPILTNTAPEASE